MCIDGLEFEKMVLNLKRMFEIQKEGFMIKRSLNRLKGFKSEKKPSQIWKDGFEYDKNVSNLNKRLQIWKECLKSEKNVSNLKRMSQIFNP